MRCFIGFLIMLFVFSCKKDENNNIETEANLKTCNWGINFKIKGDTSDYSSNEFTWTTTFVIPVSNGDTLIGDIIKVNIFKIKDTSINSIMIELHNRIEKQRTDDSFNSDSIIQRNFDKGQFEYISDYSNEDSIISFYKNNKTGISIELKDSNRVKWYSYNPDSIDSKIDQNSSKFSLYDRCDSDTTLYQGTFSCKLYNLNGEEKVIEEASFYFKLID